MHKSTSDEASNTGGIINKENLGRRVLLHQIGTGTLMYVGPIGTKDGVFCGVELDQPKGKNDGSFEGVRYFTCEPMRGLFAPAHRVELLEPIQTKLVKHETLVRSAMSAFCCSMPVVHSQEDISMTSINAASSLLMNDSWDCDSMVNSHATYTIAGPGDRSAFQFLEDIECPSELFELTDSTLKLDTSCVLEESRVGVDRLPVINDELSTPLVENLNFMDSINQNTILNLNLSLPLDISENTIKAQINGRKLSEISIDSYPSENCETSRSEESLQFEDTLTLGQELKEKAREIPLKIESESAEKKIKREKRLKKPRPPSVRELQNIPIRVNKPKPPTKTQLMMEQLKASIEADKLKPKKDVKSRVCEFITSQKRPPDTPSELAMPGLGEGGKLEEKKKPNAISALKSRGPLKNFNSRTELVEKPLATIAKPRQPPLPPKYNSFTKVTKQHPASSSSVAPTTRGFQSSALRGFQSSTSRNVSSLRSSCSAQSASGIKKMSKTDKSSSRMPEINAYKVKCLNNAVRGFDVLSIVLNHQIEKEEEGKKLLCSRIADLEAAIISQQKRFEEVHAMLENDRVNCIEEFTHNHNEELRIYQNRVEKQLLQCKENAEKRIDDLKSVHAAEVERLSRSHQIQCANLDSKLAEAEKSNEELKRNKKHLETTLTKDTNEKVSELSKEISSLNAALEMKSAEMKELRHQNAKLQLKIEEIPQKDIEISKMKHRIKELKELVEQKSKTEKRLAVKYEELQRSARTHTEMTESMLRENDLLRYRIEEMESSTSEGEQQNSTILETPRRVGQTNPRLSKSEIRQGISASPFLFSRNTVSLNESLKRAADDEVFRKSLASVYLEQGRSLASKSNLDKIYTPDGTYIGSINNVPDDTQCVDDKGSSPHRELAEPNPEIDYHKVTDSGISL